MRQLSANGQQAVNDLAQRHGFSTDAVACMLYAVVNGNGGMAQFSHPEFGGSGQWMRGGMTMIGDMFNSGLKYRVESLCADLSNLVANQPGLIQTGSFQSQSHSGQQQGNFSGQGQFDSQNSLFVPGQQGGHSNWWPGDLGLPNSTGSQNNARYAYFAQSRRLVIDVGGVITVYDTLDHQIGGFSQQQSYDGSMTFTSQYGMVKVASLPVISSNGPMSASAFAPQASSPPPTSAPSSKTDDIFATIEQLASLRSKGILSDQEFDTKKTDLLSRL